MGSRNQEPRPWARLDRTIAPPRQRALARQMRTRPTEAERKLWWHLRYRLDAPETHFRRQVRIGMFIVDFACHRVRLVIEVDGGQHAEQIEKDSQRTRTIEAEGYRVLRFWNNDVLTNINGVLETIQNAITATPTPDPSPQGGGEQAVP